MDKTGVRRISLIAGSTSSCSFPAPDEAGRKPDGNRIEAGCKLMEAGCKPDGIGLIWYICAAFSELRTANLRRR